jgi:hypothetical protein
VKGVKAMADDKGVGTGDKKGKGKKVKKAAKKKK